jgi:thioredoxin 1
MKNDELEKLKREKMKEYLKDPAQGEVITKPIEATDSTFANIVNSHPFVVIDCWAQWCAPCRMIAPIIEELAKEYAGKIVFGKLDVDKNTEIPMQYGIMSIPTLLVFKNGKTVDRIVGAMPRSMLESKLTQHL